MVAETTFANDRPTESHRGSLACDQVIQAKYEVLLYAGALRSLNITTSFGYQALIVPK